MSGFENDSRRIMFLDALRGIAIIMVVGIHATAYSGLDTETKNFVLSFFQMSVSAFFLADGYLLFFRGAFEKKFDYLQYLQKSAKRLLIPWLVFTIVYLVLRGVFEYLGYLPRVVVVGHDIPEIVKGVYLSSVSSQMYFLLSLF